MPGPQLSTSRTTGSSAADHVNDHNAAHGILNAFDTTIGTAARAGLLQWNGSVFAPSAGLQPMTLGDLRVARGVNWYGMEDGLRGPTLAELRTMVNRGFTLLRLPHAYQTTNADLAAVCANASLAGIWVLVECHNYGRIGGTADINAVDGTVITAANQQTWFDYEVAKTLALAQYPAFVPGDMNEPSQDGPTWEPISSGRVAALRTAGWTGIIGVSAANRSSAGGINSTNPATLGHASGWWITDRTSFLEVHHYLGGLSDASLQTRATLDAYAAGSGNGVTTYLQFVHKTFPFGAFGNANWDNVPILVGETSMPPGMEIEMDALLTRYDSRKVGVTWWADWSVNTGSTYPWKLTGTQRDVIGLHVNPGASLTADGQIDGDVNHVFTVADDTKLAGITAGANTIVVRWTGSTWGARPVGYPFGVFFLSTNDPAATDPPTLNRLTGDMWIRHPDATPLA